MRRLTKKRAGFARRPLWAAGRWIAAVVMCAVIAAQASNNAAEDRLKPSPAAGQGISGTHLADLPANAWRYLNPQPTKRLLPLERNARPKLQEVVRGEPAFREYTSPIYGGGKLYYFGGGHSGYPGNDVEVYDIAANTWTQRYMPECPPPGDTTYYSGGSEAISPTRKPYVLHGYARTSYDPVADRYVCTATRSMAAFDAKTGQWTWIAGMHASDGKPKMPIPDANQVSCWDEALGGFLLWGHYQFGGLWLFKDGAFQQRKNPGVSFAATGGALFTYIPDQKAHLIATLPHGDKTEPHVYLYRSVAETVAEIKSIPPELQGKLRPLGNLAFSYDRKNKKIIALSTEDGSVVVWLYDVPEDRWEKLPRHGSSPRLKTFEPGCGRGPGPFQYDPLHNVFILVIPGKDGATETWAYRNK